jgi:glycosyl hydrolase family 43
MSAVPAARPRVASAGLRVVLAALVAALVAGLLPAGEASARDARPAPVGSDRFVAGQAYRGDFPDPTVLRVGRTYYAYSTTVSSLNLPVVASSDLVHWRALGEGLMHVARWARSRRIGARTFAGTWAPTVARFGKRFVHAYAVPRRGQPARRCIAVSTSRRPFGGFVDRSTRPLLCPGTRGAIDPSFYTGPYGARYLVWKLEQTRRLPSQIYINRLSANGLRVISPSRLLLTTQDAWETPLIENPAMIRYRSRYYLFYSGGSYADDSYATGYARCASPYGPCTRVSDRPLLATGGRVSGPGGAMPFLDRLGRLRLAYAAWDLGNAGYPSNPSCRRRPPGCPQRKLHVATLGVRADGTLAVLARG